MPRLLRPPIDLWTKCRVALLATGEMFPDSRLAIARETRSLGKLLAEMLAMLAQLHRCEVKDLRLDHDPALGARQKVFNAAGEHVEYSPAANDPNHLFYRPHGAQFDKSHDIKTRVRGDHGQYSDIVLIKRERRRNKKPKKKRHKWSSQPLRSRSTFPPKGGRPFRRKP